MHRIISQFEKLKKISSFFSHHHYSSVSPGTFALILLLLLLLLVLISFNNSNRERNNKEEIENSCVHNNFCSFILFKVFFKPKPKWENGKINENLHQSNNDNNIYPLKKNGWVVNIGYNGTLFFLNQHTSRGTTLLLLL